MLTVKPVPQAGETVTFSGIPELCEWMNAHGYEIMRWVEGEITLRRRVDGNMFERLPIVRDDHPNRSAFIVPVVKP